MKKYIGCDAHARYSIFVSMDEQGKAGPPVRVEHDELEMCRFLSTLPAGSPVALETSGNWYWLVRAMEQPGLDPRLAHALEVKKRMPGRNKTDNRDAKGLALLLRNGSLPEVWVPPAALLDLGDLMRTRLSVRQQGSLLKCRIQAALRRYGVRDYSDRADLFAGKSRAKLAASIARLPQETRIATLHEWELLDYLEAQIAALEERIRLRIATIGWVRLLKTLPGVGTILGCTLYLEIGDVRRFATPEKLASYAGLVPTVHASGGKLWRGPTPRSANHFLKWAFVEAANVIVSHQKQWSQKHVVRLYQRLRAAKCHGKAATAVARDRGQLKFRRGQLKFPSDRGRVAIQVEDDLYGERSTGKTAVAAGAEAVSRGRGSKVGHRLEDSAEIPAGSKTAERNATKAYMANAARPVCGYVGRDSTAAELGCSGLTLECPTRLRARGMPGRAAWRNRESCD